MSAAILIDNWLLQSVGECMHDGLSSETASKIIVDLGSDSHIVLDVPEAGVQLEALIGLLVDIVLRDDIVVEEKFTGTWRQYGAAFKSITDGGLLRPVAFLDKGEHLREPTALLVRRLCVTSSLKEAQALNEKAWKRYGKTNDPYMSSLLWGTAGMLSRATFMGSHTLGILCGGGCLNRRLRPM